MRLDASILSHLCSGAYNNDINAYPSLLYLRGGWVAAYGFCSAPNSCYNRNRRFTTPFPSDT